MGKFEIKEHFLLNGEPFHVISGGIHYFRVVPEYWQDRLEKLKALGCNTVETYLPWNMHEPSKGVFNFEGILDVVRFVKIAQELGLYVILRPAPYICAEWDFGGLPAWLLAEDGMKLRVSYPPFLQHVEDYYAQLMKHLTPLQIDQGGPVIMMQVENEYGSYGNDKVYLEHLRDLMLKFGVTVPLVTSDGPEYELLDGGTIAGVHPTVNFGSRPDINIPILQRYTKGPLMCMEYWIGWFDHWGNEQHMTGKLEQSTADLDKMLEIGHVNLYMFHGGTNFGFMNGANYFNHLQPDVTSYDYDAVLSEDGQITEKYRRYQEVIGKYTTIPSVEFTMDIKRKAYGKLAVTEKVSLNAVLALISTPVPGVFPQSMERLGQNHGYILYRSILETDKHLSQIRLWEAHDRAQIFINHQPIATLYDRELLKEKELNVPLEVGATMDILVENMGRVNYGMRLERQRKGIDQFIQINRHIHYNWMHYPLPLDQLEKLDFTRDHEAGLPGFYRFTWMVDETADTFLDFSGWGKGCAFVNGFNIGRFWEIGPQRRLYIPGPLLHQGENEIIIFETEGTTNDHIILQAEPDIG
jgi:beta-galactosidase